MQSQDQSFSLTQKLPQRSRNNVTSLRENWLVLLIGFDKLPIVHQIFDFELPSQKALEARNERIGT